MPTITADQVRVPADVMPESREIYVENYMKATRGTGRLMLFACALRPTVPSFLSEQSAFAPVGSGMFLTMCSIDLPIVI